MSESNIADYIAQHPRMAGVLFTIFLVLSQAGNAAAANACVHSGP